MEKLAVGPGYPEGLIDLDMTPTEQHPAVAAAKGTSAARSWSACWSGRATRR